MKGVEVQGKPCNERSPVQEKTISNADTELNSEPSSRVERSYNDEDFEVISAEVKRQFELRFGTIDSLNTKISIMLGFVILVIAQVAFTSEFASVPSLTGLSLILFLLGFLILCDAGILGAYSYLTREFSVGNSPKLLMDWYEAGVEKDFRFNISAWIYKANEELKNSTDELAFYARTMIYLFFVGLVLIVVSRIVMW